MDDDFSSEFFEIIDRILEPKNLVTKKLNGRHVTGFEYHELLGVYFKLFETGKILEADAVFNESVSQQMTITTDHCYNKYKQSICKNKYLATSKIHVQRLTLHKLSKSNVLLKYSRLQKVGNFKHDDDFNNILIRKIDNFFKEHLENSENFKSEMKKASQGLDEKQTLQFKQSETEKKAKKKLSNIENKLRNRKNINDQNLLKEVEMARVRVLKERERSEEFEIENKEDEIIRLEIKKTIEVVEDKMVYLHFILFLLYFWCFRYLNIVFKVMVLLAAIWNLKKIFEKIALWIRGGPPT